MGYWVQDTSKEQVTKMFVSDMAELHENLVNHNNIDK